MDRLAPIFARGIQLQIDGRTGEALEAFEECLSIAPANPQMHLQAGLACLQLEQLGKGVAHLRAAVAADPRVAEAWMYLAGAFHRMGALDDARHVAERAVALKPDLAGAWNTLGLIEMDSGRFDPARKYLLNALELAPGLAPARMNVGVCEHALGRDDDAIASLHAALRMDPGLAQAHYNLGAIHQRRARNEEAIAHYREAVGLDPREPLAHANLAMALFSRGRLEEAWREHAWRGARLNYAAALQGQDRAYVIPSPDRIKGARLAVIAEQGIGDTLFFLRFAPALRAHVGTMDFVGDARLHPMLRRTGLFTNFSERPDDLPAGDRLDVLAGDLALILPGAAAGTPPPLPLSADSRRVDAMRAHLASFGAGPYVGIAWRAGAASEVPVAALGRALRGISATWIALQHDPRAGEIEALSREIGAPVRDLTAASGDLEDALALLEALDDYAGASSTVVDLRAALGRSARVAVAFPPEWRWMESGDRSPWFPRATLYRQAASGDWDAALAHLASELRSALTSR